MNSLRWTTTITYCNLLLIKQYKLLLFFDQFSLNTFASADSYRIQWLTVLCYDQYTRSRNLTNEWAAWRVTDAALKLPDFVTDSLIVSQVSNDTPTLRLANFAASHERKRTVNWTLLFENRLIHYDMKFSHSILLFVKLRLKHLQLVEKVCYRVWGMATSHP